MAFIQKDKNSRKDKLDAAQAGAGPEKKKPRAIIHRTADGKQHLHLSIPEGAAQKEDHLSELLAKLEARAAAEKSEEEKIEAS